MLDGSVGTDPAVALYSSVPTYVPAADAAAGKVVSEQQQRHLQQRLLHWQQVDALPKKKQKIQA